MPLEHSHKSFALPGLVAPSGILGAETGNGYGWQKPRATSRLLSPVLPLSGGRQNGVRPLFIYIDSKNWLERWARFVHIYIANERLFHAGDGNRLVFLRYINCFGAERSPALATRPPLAAACFPPLKPNATPVRSTGTLKAPRRGVSLNSKRQSGAVFPRRGVAFRATGPS